jgi:glucosamine--fructose-6-phosphate aminotransferase (isomerizing)
LPEESLTYREVVSQPEVWATILRDRGRIEEAARELRGLGLGRVVAVGCGSSHYVAQVASAALNSLARLPTLALPAGEAVTSWDEHVADEATVLLIFSRSGETTEALWAAKSHRPSFAITCAPGSTLAETSSAVLAVPEAAEESWVMTRSFSTMLLAAIALAAELGGYDLDRYRGLPDACRSVLDTERDLGEPGRVYYLGSGAAHGVAQEGMLKMTEAALVPAQAYHHLEFRHGPRAIVDEDAAVVSLSTGEVAAHEASLADELRSLGATVLSIAPPPGPDPAAEALLHAPVVQLLALSRAAAKGIDPDRPRHLDPVVRLT